MKNMSTTKILDANAILRYMLDDIKEQADIVEEALKNYEVLVLPEIVAEIVHILTKYYNYSRCETFERVFKFLEDAEHCGQVLGGAIKTYGRTNLDFVDCLLYEYSKHPNYEILTFDKKLIKLINRNEED